MYIGIDVGGTKTLVASLDDNGVITEKIRFETSKDYEIQLDLMRDAFNSLQVKEFKAGGAGVPGTLDRKHGRGLWFGNLPWKNVPIMNDLENITSCPMVVENDAKMAALSEAMLLKHDYDRVLYLTVSTGIGMAFVSDRTICPDFGDAGGRTMLAEHEGKMVPWESFVSGRAIVERFGKIAQDLDDPKAWKIICKDLALGMIELIAIFQPEVVVIGGSVGTHFDKYSTELTKQLKTYETPLLVIPPIRKAGRPEEAVLFGCYDLAKQVFPHVVQPHHQEQEPQFVHPS